MRFSNLLDIAVSDHGHKEYLRYYPLADHTVGVDIREDVHGKYDVDEFRIMDCEKKLKFEDNSFDMVLSDNTIEHLQNPLQFYKELQRIGNNLIVILTPHWLADSMNLTQKMIFPKKRKREGERERMRAHVYQFKPQWFIDNLDLNTWIIDLHYNSMPLSLGGRISIPFPYSTEIEVKLRRRK